MNRTGGWTRRSLYYDGYLRIVGEHVMDSVKGVMEVSGKSVVWQPFLGMEDEAVKKILH